MQSLTEEKILATEECSRLQRRAEVLRAVRKAEEELERIRANERSVDEARGVLAEIEENLGEQDLRYEQATSALVKVEEELRMGRDRLAKASGARDNVRENAQHVREARRAELVAKRDAAAWRAQSAREVIQAREQVQVRERELVQAEAEYQRTQQAADRAQNLAELAKLLAAWRQATDAVAALKVAQTERHDRAAGAAAKEAELKNAEAALQDAERAVTTQKDALAAAQRETAEGELRKETLGASLIRAETAEREALQARYRVKAVIASSERLAEAERSLADLEAGEGDLEAKLTANAAGKQACEARRLATTPLPLRAALLAGLLGAATAAAVGIGLKLHGGFLALAMVGCGLLASGLTAVVLQGRKLREAHQAWRREFDDLARARADLLEGRNQLSTKRGVAQVRVDAARSERDRAVAAVGESGLAFDKAEPRLQKARRELDGIREELATLDGRQPRPGAVRLAQAEAAERAVAVLNKEVPERRRIIDEAHHAQAEAQVRLEAATSSAACVDLADLERRVTAARRKVGQEADLLALELEGAQTGVQLARETAAKLEMTVKVARGRRSDGQSSYQELAAKLGQSADQALAEAEKEREDADKALEDLDETSCTEVEAVEREFSDAHAEVARLVEEQTAARTRVNAATQTRDETRAKHNEARGTFASLFQSVPTINLPDAQAALAQARRALESDAGQSTSSPEDLTAAEALLDGRQAELRRTEDDLHAARGQLELVGGAVAREQRDEEFERLEALRKSAAELELEYKATKRLLDTLKEADAKHAAHLGRSLAKPVTEMFLEFTGGRYAQVDLDPGLRLRNLVAMGAERELGSLSVGTRHQLATLVRLALAAHLKSVVVLDDQLTQSDRGRLVWFRDRLRASVRDHDHQIIVITCRPLDYLHPEEMPAPPCDRLETEDGSLAVLDLEQVASCA